MLESSLRKVANHVVKQEWSSATELQKYVQNITSGLDSHCSLLIISVMSHGTMGAVCGPDGVLIPINDLIHQLSEAISPDLQLVNF